MPDRTKIPLTIETMKAHRADRAYVIAIRPKITPDYSRKLDNINMVLNPMQILTSKHMKHGILTGITD